MITLIDDHRRVHGVEPIREVLPTAPSSHRERVAQRRDPGKLSARAQRHLKPRPAIARVFAEDHAVYGVREVWRQLLREESAVARYTVERLMGEMGLQGVIRGRTVRTIVSDKHLFAQLLRCGCCGGGFSTISATHLGCSTARNKGETACIHRRTVKREVLEATVLDAVRTRLTSPKV